MEQDTGFEPALSAWKADVLAADTNPAYGSFPVFWRYYLTQVDFVVCSQITRSNKTKPKKAEMNELFLLFESGVVIKLSLSHAVSITLDRQKTLLGLTLTENSRAQNNSCISLKSRNGACGEIRTRDSLLKRQVL